MSFVFSLPWLRRSFGEKQKTAQEEMASLTKGTKEAAASELVKRL